MFEEPQLPGGTHLSGSVTECMYGTVKVSVIYIYMGVFV